jgi:hypothetical protein
VPAKVTIPKEPHVTKLEGARAPGWLLPLDEAFLEEFLTYVFSKYWDQIVFGPMIEGAAYELACPSPPSKIKLFDGYLTVSFGGRISICASERTRARSNTRPPTRSSGGGRRAPRYFAGSTRTERRCPGASKCTTAPASR